MSGSSPDISPELKRQITEIAEVRQRKVLRVCGKINEEELKELLKQRILWYCRQTHQ